MAQSNTDKTRIKRSRTRCDIMKNESHVSNILSKRCEDNWTVPRTLSNCTHELHTGQSNWVKNVPHMFSFLYNKVNFQCPFFFCVCSPSEMVAPCFCQCHGAVHWSRFPFLFLLLGNSSFYSTRNVLSSSFPTGMLSATFMDDSHSLRLINRWQLLHSKVTLTVVV